MARVNLERRAAIGEAKRARTRLTILDAARACYAAERTAPVTVEAVVQAAGLAKGTFYLHFQDLAALEAEVGGALLAELGERLEPARLAVRDPLTRMATAVTILLRDLAAEPAQARLAAHAIVAIPEVAHAVQARLRADLAEAQSAGLLAIGSVDLAARIVVASVRAGGSALRRRPDRPDRRSRTSSAPFCGRWAVLRGTRPPEPTRRRAMPRGLRSKPVDRHDDTGGRRPDRRRLTQACRTTVGCRPIYKIGPNGPSPSARGRRPQRSGRRRFQTAGGAQFRKKPMSPGMPPGKLITIAFSL